MKNELPPPAQLQLILRRQLDPVGKVLQGAVLEAGSASEGPGIGEGGSPLEDLAVARDVVIHV